MVLVFGIYWNILKQNRGYFPPSKSAGDEILTAGPY